MSGVRSETRFRNARRPSASLPTGVAGAVMELADVRPVEPGFIELGRAIECLCDQLWEVAARGRQRSELLGALDAVSKAVLVDVDRTLEEQLWMMRAQLPG